MKTLSLVAVMFSAGVLPCLAAPITVQPGESLWSISLREFGDGSRWTELCQTNQAILRDCAILHPGLILQTNRPDEVEPPVAEIDVKPEVVTTAVRIERGPNLVSDQDFSGESWVGYWVKPTMVAAISDPDGGDRAVRFASEDKTKSPGQNMSGVYFLGDMVPGTYSVSLWVRAVSGELSANVGIADGASRQIQLTEEWQKVDISIELSSTENRVFQIYESTANNSAWEIYDVDVSLAEGS